VKDLDCEKISPKSFSKKDSGFERPQTYERIKSFKIELRKAT
jgi:hypothetical protein